MKLSNSAHSLLATLILSYCISLGSADAGQATGSTTIAPGLKGQITGITVTPSPQFAGQPVAIRVDGSGKCSFNLVLESFGTRSVPDTDLPTIVTTQFASGGNFQFTARATGVDCVGEASTTTSIVGLTRVTTTLGAGKAWNQVTIAVENNVGQPCSANVDFGDSSKIASLYRQQIIQTTHTYAKPGSYRVIAWGTESFCPGQVDTTINVRDPAANVDPSTAPPVITGTSPPPQITVIPGPTLTGFAPGSQFVIFLKAENLGYTTYPAILHLRERDVTLTVDRRLDDRYLVTIPGNIIGVFDQQATIQVYGYDARNGTKKPSNLYPIPFVATRESVSWQGDPNLVKCACSNESDQDVCTTTGGSGFLPQMNGFHHTGCCADTGSDRWEFPVLKNGWVYAEVKLLPVHGGYRDAANLRYNLFGSSLTVNVDWANSAIDSATSYHFVLGITGPKGGIPYQ